jgi:hypothetical protein
MFFFDVSGFFYLFIGSTDVNSVSVMIFRKTHILE